MAASFEYATQHFQRHDAGASEHTPWELDRVLNARALDGWRLAHLVTLHDAWMLLIFEREK